MKCNTKNNLDAILVVLAGADERVWGCLICESAVITSITPQVKVSPVEQIKRVRSWVIIAFVIVCTSLTNLAAQMSTQMSSKPANVGCDAQSPVSASRVRGQLARQLSAYPPARTGSKRRVLLAVTLGYTDSVVRAVTALGGVVEYRHDPVGYLRVRVPGDVLSRLTDIPAVDAILLVPTFPQFRGWHDVGAASAGSHAAPPAVSSPADGATALNASLAADNPYTSAVGMDAEAFRARHPTFDGRGITIAINDEGMDLLLPQMQTALTPDGRPTPKIVDILTANDARISDPGSGWVSMQDTVVATAKTIQYQGAEYVVPAPGLYRTGQFDERSEWSRSSFRQDIDLDGNPLGSTGIFSVLWDERMNTVWVDTDRDRDFSNEKALTD